MPTNGRICRAYKNHTPPDVRGPLNHELLMNRLRRNILELSLSAERNPLVKEKMLMVKTADVFFWFIKILNHFLV